MMTKREKRMFLSIILLLCVFAHIWGVTTYLRVLKAEQAKALELSMTAETYKTSALIKAQIEAEMEWLREHAPEPKSFGDAETQLLALLQQEGKQCGLETEKPKFLRVDDHQGRFRRARIEISATASEEQIYKWIVSLHKPTKLRAITQMQLRPDLKDKTRIVCTLVAEQWLIEKKS